MLCSLAPMLSETSVHLMFGMDPKNYLIIVVHSRCFGPVFLAPVVPKTFETEES